MAKFKVVVRPTGLLNGALWPDEGEFVELDEAVAASMVDAGTLEAVQVEKRPASKRNVETRKED